MFLLRSLLMFVLSLDLFAIPMMILVSSPHSLSPFSDFSSPDCSVVGMGF